MAISALRLNYAAVTRSTKISDFTELTLKTTWRRKVTQYPGKILFYVDF